MFEIKQKYHPYCKDCPYLKRVASTVYSLDGSGKTLVYTCERFNLCSFLLDRLESNRGKWELEKVGTFNDLSLYRCSKCGYPLPLNPGILPKYCENCGAKMENTTEGGSK